jgi:hypothetical protein
MRPRKCKTSAEAQRYLAGEIVGHSLGNVFRVFGIIGLAALLVLGCSDSTPTEPQNFTVEGRVALASLMSLSDSHLQETAGHFQVMAASEDLRSTDWQRIRPRLAAVEQVSTPGLFWYALADGSYWSVAQGKAAGSLSDRPYWPRLMAGNVVLGDLVACLAPRCTRQSEPAAQA